MACFILTKPFSMWYLTGDNSGYGDKFQAAVSGLCEYQEMLMLDQSDQGKDYDYTTEAYINTPPKNGAYIAFGSYSGVNPPNNALQIKRIIKSTLQDSLWMVRLG